MKNVNRIDEFVSRLAKAWKGNPDLRFGEMILGVFKLISLDGREPFNMEEDEMIQYIELYMYGKRSQNKSKRLVRGRK